MIKKSKLSLSTDYSEGSSKDVSSTQHDDGYYQPFTKTLSGLLKGEWKITDEHSLSSYFSARRYESGSHNQNFSGSWHDATSKEFVDFEGEVLYTGYISEDQQLMAGLNSQYSGYTSDVTWDYTETVNEDGTITLNLSNGVQEVENAAYGNEPITYDFSTGYDTPTLTSTYYERGEPVETTGQFTRVYSGIEKVIGSTFQHAVSGKSIASFYTFNADGTAVFKLIKYSKTTDYGHYKYQITAWNVLSADEVSSTADAETKVLAFDKTSLAHALNTYAVHFVYAATEPYTLEANDYSQGYGNASVTSTKDVTEGAIRCF